MATAADIGWSGYRQFEGPFYLGKNRYQLPKSPTEEQLILAVITATEGGRWDAYNGYDRCICTSGLIQWCESGQYSVSDMLGKVVEKNPDLLKSVDLMATNGGLEFQKNARGRWRFFFRDARGEVDRQQEQQQMFLLRSNGQKGTWDAESKLYAKQWAAAISSVWEHAEAQRIQGDYTARRLFGFALPYAAGVLKSAPATNIGRAFKASYLSFAANNPTWANRHLERANQSWKGAQWTQDWLIHVLKELTFGPKVAIYPHRYRAIRPVLERFYGLDLPDLADELKAWQAETRISGFLEPKELQEALRTLGFDLGPANADGLYDAGKTREALLSFEQQAGVPVEHQDGMPDIHTIPKLEAALERRGLELLK